jgi:cytochrome b
LVIAIAVAFLSSEEDSILNNWHVIAGWTATVLLAFRLAWGFVGGEHSRFSDFIRPSLVMSHLSALLRGPRHFDLGHNPLGGLAVVVLLGLIAATIWSGAFGGEAAEEFHEIVAWTLLAMIGIHVVAVVVMSAIERENLARAMVTGDKSRARHPGSVHARPPSALGWLVGMIVLGATLYGILLYDPQAFTLRPGEAFEHRINDSDAHRSKLEREHDD